MIPSAQVEQQLSAMAAAVDRANRPLSLLSIPILLVMVSAVFALWSWRGVDRERGLVRARLNEAQMISQRVSEIKAERAKAIDIESLYPPMPYVGSQVDEAWKKNVQGFRETPNVGSPTTSDIISNPRIARTDVDVVLNNEPLPLVLQGIEATLNHEFLKGSAAVSQVQLTPAGNGWRSAIRFTAYHRPL